MTAVLEVILPILAILFILAALLFAFLALQARSKTTREAYGVGRQEARSAMQVAIVRAGVSLVVALILLGVFGLGAQSEPVEPAATFPPPTRQTNAPTNTPAALLVTDTPGRTPTAAATPTSPVPTLTPTPVPTDTPTPEPRTATVNIGVGVWLRAEPGRGAEQLEWVLDGTALLVLPGTATADDLEWQQVRTPAGNEGWVAVDYITFANEP